MTPTPLPAHHDDPDGVDPAAPVAGPPVLPDLTRDETDVGWGAAPWRDDPDDDERFLRERPPHWQ